MCRVESRPNDSLDATAEPRTIDRLITIVLNIFVVPPFINDDDSSRADADLPRAVKLAVVLNVRSGVR
jgi:hypothetical protein